MEVVQGGKTVVTGNLVKSNLTHIIASPAIGATLGAGIGNIVKRVKLSLTSRSKKEWEWIA